MKRFLAFAFIGLAAVLLVRGFASLRSRDWEARLESMPETSPAKWLFTNIAAIRKNTDTILERAGRSELPVEV
jgi:hypothetical protein